MARFYKAALQGEIADGEVKTVRVGGQFVALFNLGGEFFALGDACPHRGGHLGCGTIEDGAIICPLHGWSFDIRTGAQRMGPSADRFTVRLDGEDILVKV